MPPRSTTKSEIRRARAAVGQAVMCDNAPAERAGHPTELELKIARKNALGLEFATRFPGAVELLTEQREKAEQFSRTMHATSELFNAHGIEHLYIKFRKLYAYHDSNADVVVRAERWTEAQALLRAAGYTPHVMFKEPDKVMFDKAGEVSVHLHPGVTWNGVPYFDPESLWANSTRSVDGPWRELSADHDFLVNIAHNLFENYVFSLGDILYFKRYLQAREVDVAVLSRIADENGWHGGFERGHAQVRAILDGWAAADRTGDVPDWLLTYPYQIPLRSLVPTYSERVAHQLRGRRYRLAGREVYAYPAFYALKRRHDLPGLRK